MYRPSLFSLPLVLTIVAASSVVADAGEKHLLRYSMQSGEDLQYEVTHVAKTKTKIGGTEEISQVHTTSKRRLDVIAADQDVFSFHHIVDAVAMTQQQGEKEEIRWDSESGDEAPREFSKVAEQIGQRVATVTINPRGQETQREDDSGTKASLGMGSLTLALPENAIEVGESWAVPREVRTRTDEGEVQLFKIRELYTLEKVKTGVATLSVKSEPLTPINEESIRAQVIQQLSNGTIRFDIDNGRLLTKQLDWDETVVGFQGANSMMEYRAKLTERLLDGVQRTAKR